MRRMWIAVTCMVLGFAGGHAVLAAQSTDPAAFTRVSEVPENGSPRAITHPYAEVDNRSQIQIAFDVSKMAAPVPLVPGGPKRPLVEMRIEAIAHQGTSETLIAPIPYYVSMQPSASKAASGKAGGASASPFLFHDKYYAPALHAIPPDTEITLRGSGGGGAA